MEDSAKKQLDEEKMVNDAFQHLINTYLASRHRKKAVSYTHLTLPTNSLV